MRMDGCDGKVFCLMGDGECQEGQIWEAAMSAAHFGLGNIIGIVDFNNQQIDGEVSSVMGIEPFADKWKIVRAGMFIIATVMILKILLRPSGKLRLWALPIDPLLCWPLRLWARVCRFFEGTMPDNSNWHGKPPSKEDAAKALEILSETVYGDF